MDETFDCRLMMGSLHNGCGSWRCSVRFGREVRHGRARCGCHDVLLGSFGGVDLEAATRPIGVGSVMQSFGGFGMVKISRWIAGALPDVGWRRVALVEGGRNFDEAYTTSMRGTKNKP